MNLFAVLVKKVADLAPKILFALITVLWLCNLQFQSFDKQAIVFFIYGYYAVKYNITFATVDKINWKIISCIWIVFIYASYWCRDGVIHRILVLVTILVMIKFSDIIEKNINKSIYLWLAQYTFLVYVFHVTVLTVIKKIFVRYVIQYGWVQLLEYFIMPIFAGAICIIMSITIKQMFPKLYQWMTGER